MKLLLVVKMAMQSLGYLPENDRKCARKATNMHFQSFLRHTGIFDSSTQCKKERQKGRSTD